MSDMREIIDEGRDVARSALDLIALYKRRVAELEAELVAKEQCLISARRGLLDLEYVSRSREIWLREMIVRVEALDHVAGAALGPTYTPTSREMIEGARKALRGELPPGQPK